MYFSNSAMEYITMPPTFVHFGPPPVTLLRQLLSAETLTPKTSPPLSREYIGCQYFA
jgi:hypothetical protein